MSVNGANRSMNPGEVGLLCVYICRKEHKCTESPILLTCPVVSPMFKLSKRQFARLHDTLSVE
jgi:hypothetical protein